MVNTSKEILLWIASDFHNAKLLNMSRQRLAWLRMKLKQDALSEERKEEYLKKIQKNIEDCARDTSAGYYTCPFREVVCLRPRYVLPAVVCDHHGRLFQETTLVRICHKQKGFEDLNLHKVVSVLGHKDYLPKEELVRELLRRKGWNMVEPRHELPSVWRVE